MKAISSLITFIIIGLISSCNYKKLGCVICQTRKKKSIETYSNQQVKKITKKQIKSMRAIDVPFKENIRVVKYDSTGRVIEKTKKITIGSVWNFESRDIKQKSKIDSLNGEYMIIEKFIMKNGKTIENTRKIKRKNVV